MSGFFDHWIVGEPGDTAGSVFDHRVDGVPPDAAGSTFDAEIVAAPSISVGAVFDHVVDGIPVPDIAAGATFDHVLISAPSPFDPLTPGSSTTEQKIAGLLAPRRCVGTGSARSAGTCGSEVGAENIVTS